MDGDLFRRESDREQVERAADVLIANSQRKGRGVGPNTINWSAARTQLSGVLSPSQIETLGLFVKCDRPALETHNRGDGV